MERETIELVHTEPTDVAQLPSRVPREAARYHFFLYRHTHEGDPLESVGEWGGAPGGRSGRGCGAGGPPRSPGSRPVPAVFIYSMPGYKCSIRERMLYSSCKSRLLDSAEQDFQLEIAKKVGALVTPRPCPAPTGAWRPETGGGAGPPMPIGLGGERRPGPGLPAGSRPGSVCPVPGPEAG